MFKEERGESYPLGATLTPEGVNFAVYSKRAEYIELLLFESENAREPLISYKLTPEKSRTANYWHIFLHGVKANQVYAYRVHGAHDPRSGVRFDHNKVLLDPYSRGVVGYEHYSRKDAIAYGDNCATSLRSVVLDWNSYDWRGDRRPFIPYSKTFIYEVHVGGFTKNPNSGVAPEKRGTFAGLCEKIPYLKQLGVTTLELLPVQAFDKQDAPAGLVNYWGYSPVGFFAPHMDYSSVKTAIGALDEFRDMVRLCHENGLEVILDVVFNHTTENDENGPTICFRGLDNFTYYTLDEQDLKYKNLSGCGNALRSEHPVVGRLILDALRFWVQDMHVDGFRFDLASVLSRDVFGNPQERPPILWTIESDPVLASCKLILEAWDPAGLYQVGWFIARGTRYAEWNGPFRDDVRRFVKGDCGSIVAFAERVSGSRDIYGENGGSQGRTIHFVTCHDGFTLSDLVSYNEKHNLDNLEDNRDGTTENYSWNCGLEGPTVDPQVEKLRLKQIKNMLVILLLSQGVPMLSHGDEVRRTTGGNNNPYCQDNQTNWFDWDLVVKNDELLRFASKLIALSKRLSNFRKGTLIESDEVSAKDAPVPHRIQWHGVRQGRPDFSYDSHSLAIEMSDPLSKNQLFMVFNAYWEALEFEIPSLSDAGSRWHVIIDTAAPAGKDIIDGKDAPTIDSRSMKVAARSCVCLMSSGLISEPEPSGVADTNLPRRKKLTWTIDTSAFARR